MRLSHRVDKVAVAGAGIGGLMSGLALAAHGIEVVVFERDPAPPQGVAPEDSMSWLRRSVPQALHPHFFMGRLRVLLETRYPDLVARLLEAGVGESGYSDYLHPAVRSRYRARSDDVRMRSLNARRTTFEMIVRDYVTARGGIDIRDDARVVGLVTDDIASRPVRVLGLDVETKHGREHCLADAVIDASGRFSRLAEQLRSSGVPMHVDQRDSGLWYFTRHYRLRRGCTYPPIHGLPGAMFPDFIVGALPADNGTFTVTFQIYREDREVAKALRDPGHFQAMCQATAVIAPWVDPARAEPTSDVYGFGQMDSFWRRTVIDGEPQVLGFFCVGDSCVRSNPKFGRGCTWTTVAAHHVADLLSSDDAPAKRIVRYERLLDEEFRQDWLTMRSIDASTETAFQIAAGRRRATLRDRVSRRFQRLLNEACVVEPAVLREVWAGYHGLQGMSDWARKPMMWLKLAQVLMRSSNDRDLVAPLAGRPTRQMLTATGPSTPAAHS